MRASVRSRSKKHGESGGTSLVMRPGDRHGNGGVVVFQTGKVMPPYLAGAAVTVVDLIGEGEVEAFYVGREDCGTRA